MAMNADEMRWFALAAGAIVIAIAIASEYAIEKWSLLAAAAAFLGAAGAAQFVIDGPDPGLNAAFRLRSRRRARVAATVCRNCALGDLSGSRPNQDMAAGSR